MAAKPTAESLKVPKNEVNNSGADPPAAINVAPATSLLNFHLSAIISNDGTKNSSTTIDNAINI
eukprot:CAMPEP_0114670456 /NCGR_PEP_ID=MMETSP0191-20121206/39535_1 /TAXON_ID=126664 /ORGANISM="Sorites sp." /LENGTH=63 /DNA_ID=CAMNT_0001928035 /DNA_START=1207 /DNA_END=1398 /DNA_ORIENTATION=+